MGVAGLFISHFHQGLVLQMEDAPRITQLTSLMGTAQQGSLVSLTRRNWPRQAPEPPSASRGVLTSQFRFSVKLGPSSHK